MMTTAPIPYSEIERLLADALPEIKEPAEHYWKTEGRPGEDCGPYIFFEDMFGCYVEVLLAMDVSPGRDRLVRRAFDYVEQMLKYGDPEVRNLAFIGFYEGRGKWWFFRARPFIGSQGVEALDAYQADWRDWCTKEGAAPDSGLIDLWGVRDAIARQLSSEGVALSDIPGETHLATESEQTDRADADTRRGSS